MKKPNFFIVGAPKCGTTSLYYYLNQHPDVFMPVEKELYFFGKDLFKFKQMTLKEYLSKFSGAKNEKAVGEATPTYIYSKTAPNEIKKFATSPKIIIMLRNPVDMVYSQFLYNQRGFIEKHDFETALELEKERSKGKKLPGVDVSAGDKSKLKQVFLYRENAKYYIHVKRYLDVFGKKNVHVIIFNDFVKNSKKSYEKTCDFLGIDNKFRPEIKKKNPGGQLKHRKIGLLIKNPPPAVRVLKKPLDLLPLDKRRRLFRLSERLYIQKGYPPMKPETKEKLKKEFLPEIKKLEKLLGKDLSVWK